MKGHGAKYAHKMEQAIAALLTHRSVEDAARAVGITFGWLVPMTALCGLALAVATVARSANTGVAAGVAGWALVMLAGQASKGRFTAAIGDSALVLPYLAFAAICVAIVLFATRTPRGTT